MASYNNITLLGNIGSIRVKSFSNGGKVAEASLATSKKYKDRNNVEHDDTQWHNLVISGPLADVAEKYVTSGDPLFVTGEMTYREYQDTSGAKKRIAAVRVLQLQLLPKAARPTDAQVPRPAPAPVQEEPEGEDLPF